MVRIVDFPVEIFREIISQGGKKWRTNIADNEFPWWLRVVQGESSLRHTTPYCSVACYRWCVGGEPPDAGWLPSSARFVGYARSITRNSRSHPRLAERPSTREPSSRSGETEIARRTREERSVLTRQTLPGGKSPGCVFLVQMSYSFHSNYETNSSMRRDTRSC